MSHPLEVRPTPLDAPDAQLLVAEVQAEYTRLYGGPDDAPVEDDGFVAPRGAFFVGYADGHPVAMGGWRLRDDVRPWDLTPSAEIKRMYVVPAARRRGHARTVLAHLEATAAQAGARAMVLETGTMQPEAIAMYQAAGYLRIHDFGHYAWSPLSRCYGRRL